MRRSIFPRRGIAYLMHQVAGRRSQPPHCTCDLRSVTCDLLLLLRWCGAGLLGPILRAPLLAVGDALSVECAAHNVVAHTGQILNAAAADQHYRVLLQVVALARDVGRNLNAIAQPDAGDLAE